VHKGEDKLYAVIIDLAGVSIALSTCVFFLWCWFAFAEDRKRHPIYRHPATTEIHRLEGVEERRHCA